MLSSGLKPRMPFRRVIDDQIHDDPNADLVGMVHEVDEIAERAELRMDRVIVGDVVPVVPIGRLIKRLQPEARNSQAGEIIEPPRQSGEVADAVRVGVDVLLDVETVDDRILVPEIINHHYSEGLRPSDSLARALARRYVGSLRSRGLTRALVRQRPCHLRTGTIRTTPSKTHSAAKPGSRVHWFPRSE